MTAVENYVVWRSLKVFNLKQREKLLAAICKTFQETVQGNPQRSTVGRPDDFRDWGRRSGTDDEAAQLVMQNQWGNLLHHLMGITAAMEVWNQNASSSSSLKGDNCSGDVHMASAAEEVNKGTLEENPPDHMWGDPANMEEERGKGEPHETS